MATLYRERLQPRQPAIRVFTLLPGPWDAPIKCDLRTIPFDTDLKDEDPEGDLTADTANVAVAYVALSYAWGDPEDRTFISVNDTDLGFLEISKNACEG